MRPRKEFQEVAFINWTHNRSPEGKILWGPDNLPVHWWEAQVGSFNGILVMRQNPEKTTYNIIYKDNSTDRYCNEPHYDKALVTAIEMIERRMIELGVKYNVEDAHDLWWDSRNKLNDEVNRRVR